MLTLTRRGSHLTSACTIALLAARASLGAPPAAEQGLPSESPKSVTAHADTFDYVRRNLMIPMRDGVKLYTLILIPRGARRARSS